MTAMTQPYWSLENPSAAQRRVRWSPRFLVSPFDRQLPAFFRIHLVSHSTANPGRRRCDAMPTPRPSSTFLQREQVDDARLWCPCQCCGRSQPLLGTRDMWPSPSESTGFGACPGTRIAKSGLVVSPGSGTLGQSPPGGGNLGSEWWDQRRGGEGGQGQAAAEHGDRQPRTRTPLRV